MGLVRGIGDTQEHNIWVLMKRRCESSWSEDFRNYGGRGIRVHPTWSASFEAFYRDVGSRPSEQHSIDRIDPERGYEPGNVRWSLNLVQQRNRTNNRRITNGGETLTLVEWSERTGIESSTISRRLRRGWSVARALSEAPKLRPKVGNGMPLCQRLESEQCNSNNMLHPKTRIQQALLDLGEYELEVVAEFSRRVLVGQQVYGKFNPTKETRNLLKERYEEQLDDQVYGTYLEVLRRVREIEAMETERDPKSA